MKTVVLVPWRGGDERREATWDVVRSHLESYGWEVVTGDRPGPWNRSAAINAASEAAGAWDVAVIADADTIHGPDVNLLAAVMRAYSNSVAVVPWRTRWRLSEAASQDVTTVISTFDETTDLDPNDGYAHNDRIASYPSWRVGSTTVIARAAWDDVGGMDEGFVGWGFEDCAHRMALMTLSYLARTDGTIWHLYHPHDSRGNPRNRRRFLAYRDAFGHPDAMRALLREFGVV